MPAGASERASDKAHGEERKNVHRRCTSSEHESGGATSEKPRNSREKRNRATGEVGRTKERETHTVTTDRHTAAVAHDHEILMAVNRRCEVRREVARRRPTTSERPSERASERANERGEERERKKDDGARRRADYNCVRGPRYGVRFKKRLPWPRATSHVTVGRRTTYDA